MDLYTFVVEDFVISQTRSLHSDTLHLSHSAFVDGDLVANTFHLLGDFDNGEYSPKDYVSSDVSPGVANVVINNPSAQAAFVFQLVNAGHVSQGTAVAGLAAAADKLKDIVGGLAGAGATAVVGAVTGSVFPAGLAIAAFGQLWSWAAQDSDGPIAADQLSGPRYVLDAWTDNESHVIRTSQRYLGTDSPIGAGDSDYRVTWSLRHRRDWVQIAAARPDVELVSDTAVAAATHHGGLHVFGLRSTGELTHARTFTGAVWAVDALGEFPDLLIAPTSAVSFNDRLLVYAVNSDGVITSLVHTTDGGTWRPFDSTPAPRLTDQSVALAVLENRMCMVARDRATKLLGISFTSDVRIWTPWIDVPSAGLTPRSTVTATALDGTLFLFGLYETGKAPNDVVVVVNSSTDAISWTGWGEIEAGVRPEAGGPTDQPLDVAATTFEGRLHLAVRWSSDDALETTHYIASNSSDDGRNWSGWRIPDADTVFGPSTGAAVAGVDGHLYILSAAEDLKVNDSTRVWSY